MNKQTATIYPLKKPNKIPKPLSMDPTPVQVIALLKDFPIKNVPLYVGGPVETNSIFFIHKCENINNCVRINSNLFFGGDFKELIFKLKRKEIKINDIIFFVGYSGWSKNQLKEEIIKKYWITKNDKYLDLFNKMVFTYRR